MQKKIILLILILFAGCKVNIVQIPLPKKIKSNTYATQRTLYVGSVKINWAKRIVTETYMRKTLISYIKSKSFFKSVQELPSKRVKLLNYLILNIYINPQYTYKYFWWITWPAIYPLSAYWPIQIRQAKFRIVVSAKLVNEEGKEIKKIEIRKTGKEITYIYSFFRTHSVERMIRKVFHNILEEIANEVSNENFIKTIEKNNKKGNIESQRNNNTE